MNKNESEKDEKKWYQDPAWIILLLIFFFPAGIYLMWRYTDWSKKSKWVVTAGIAFLVIGIFASELDTVEEADKTSENKVITEEQTDETEELEEEKEIGNGSTQNASEESFEYQLAVIHKGGYVDKDDPTVNRFRYLLKTINGKTKNSKQEVSDMTCKGWEMVKDDYGVEISLLEFMEGANDSLPNNNVKYNYGDILAGYMVILGQ